MINEIKSPKKFVTTMIYAIFKAIEKSSLLSPLLQVYIYNKKPRITKPRKAYRKLRKQNCKNKVK